MCANIQKPTTSNFVSDAAGGVYMPEKKEYRNAIRSRRLIRAAFVNLMHEKPFDKITATDIINRAEINRSTFYAHYPDVKAVVGEITGEILLRFRELLSELDLSTFFDNPNAIVKNVSELLYENLELYRLMGQSTMATEHLEQMKKLLIHQIMDAPNLPKSYQYDLENQLRIRLLMNGIVDTYRQWLNGEIDCTLDEICNGICKILCRWANGGKT